MKLIVQEDVFVGNDLNIEFSLKICFYLGLRKSSRKQSRVIAETDKRARFMRVTYKIHRRPIILSIEMDAYPSLEDRRRSHE